MPEITTNVTITNTGTGKIEIFGVPFYVNVPRDISLNAAQLKIAREMKERNLISLEEPNGN